MMQKYQMTNKEERIAAGLVECMNAFADQKEPPIAPLLEFTLFCSGLFLGMMSTMTAGKETLLAANEARDRAILIWDYVKTQSIKVFVQLLSRKDVSDSFSDSFDEDSEALMDILDDMNKRILH